MFTDISAELFGLADNMKTGEYIKDPSISLDTALLISEFGVEQLDVSQYMRECYDNAIAQIEGPQSKISDF